MYPTSLVVPPIVPVLWPTGVPGGSTPLMRPVPVWTRSMTSLKTSVFFEPSAFPAQVMASRCAMARGVEVSCRSVENASRAASRSEAETSSARSRNSAIEIRPSDGVSTPE